MHVYTPVAYLHYSLHPRCNLQHRHAWPRYARVPASEVSKWDQTPKWTPGRTDPSWEIVVKEWLHVTSKKWGVSFLERDLEYNIWEIFGGHQDFFFSEMLRGGGARAQSKPCWGWYCIIVCVIVWCCAIVEFCQHKNNRRWCPCFFLYIAFIYIIPFNLFVCVSSLFGSSCFWFFWQKKKRLFSVVMFCIEHGNPTWKVGNFVGSNNLGRFFSQERYAHGDAWRRWCGS